MEKRVYNWTGSAWQEAPALRRRFVWSGWLLLMELDQNNAVIRKYSWGLDLAGQAGPSPDREGAVLEAAGGIGGLLALEDLDQGTSHTGGFLYLYDANGNVGQLIDADDGAVAVKYQYDPYGARVGVPVYGELTQPFCFSTKYFDSETGLSYFGYRYYSARLGRWLSRDAIEEKGGLNLQAYTGNAPLARVDALGLQAPWNVSVTKGTQYGTIDAQFTVFVPCCMCDAVRWVQLIREETVAGRGYIIDRLWPFTSDWQIDLKGAPYPWYPYPSPPDYTTTLQRKCVRVSQLTDTPGFFHWLSSWNMTWFTQDFESCAICIKRASTTGKEAYACVLGCVRWGHAWKRGWSGGWHTFYGNGATPGPASDRMKGELYLAGLLRGLEITQDCWQSPCD